MNAASKTQLWIGRVLSGIAILFLLFDGITKLMHIAPVVETMTQLGYPESSITTVGVLVFICTALYALPRTAALGAVLLMGFLGGAGGTCQ
ncbi:MAG: DoxX family protein [Candidatus Manganitrophaceae bacterium]